MIEFTYEDRRDLLRWALSGVIILTIHGGIAAAMVQWRDTDAAEPTAAMVIDLAPFPVSPAVVPTDIAPGPEQVEAEAAPETPVDKPEETREETAETKDVPEFQPEIAPALRTRRSVAALPPEARAGKRPAEGSQPPAPVTTAPQVPPLEVAPVAAAPTPGQPTISNSGRHPDLGAPAWSACWSATSGIRPLPRRVRRRAPPSSRSAWIGRAGDVEPILRSSGSAALDKKRSNSCGARATLPAAARGPCRWRGSACRCRSNSTSAERPRAPRQALASCCGARNRRN